MEGKDEEVIRLSKFSHGAGCGCKLSPAQLEEVLKDMNREEFPSLLVGNSAKDDAAVMDIGDGKLLISTVDFFMPIVDDPFEFGRVAAVNAINDVYAMGGKPIMALALLGWPISKLPASAAGEVVKGAQSICSQLGIPLAGGHSIDNLEPLFGLSVNGLLDKASMKTNAGAKPGDHIYLTKSIGTGILATALKREQANEEQKNLLNETLTEVNSIGAELGKISGVHAMTDVTGFALAGHLIEMCEASGCAATIEFDAVPILNMDLIKPLLDAFVIPDNTFRNFSSYGSKLSELSGIQMQILCDPQTSGGLLIAVDPQAEKEILELGQSTGVTFNKIGEFTEPAEKVINVT